VPITAALVLPGPAGQLVVVGGEVASGQSATGAFLVNPATGALRLVANLAVGVHEAAGAVLGGRDYVFGGASGGLGGPISSVVQSFPAPTTTQPGAAVAAVASGHLPAPRAADVAVTVGTATYLVGGYSGPAAVAKVLRTSDGSTFTPVGNLAVPVRDAAVGALDGQIYVFGGAKPVASVHGVDWEPVADIQRFDPTSGEASIIGHLPLAVSGAVAANLGGHLYVAGGDTALGANATIWGFEATRGAVVVSGHLPVPVSGAGAADDSGGVWLIGGTRAGRPVGSVQVLRLR
jgi:hypothetical protein